MSKTPVLIPPPGKPIVAAPTASAPVKPAPTAETSPFVPVPGEVKAETPAREEVVATTTSRARLPKWAVAALVILVVGQAGVIAALLGWNAFGSAPVSSAPPPQVVIPPPPVTREKPATTSSAAAAAPTKGQIEVSSEPAGARVIIDGAERGQTPLTLPFDPGSHTVVVSDGRSNTTRTVEVTAGNTVSVVAALAPAGPAAGWLTLVAPVELQVFEGGTLVGTSANQKIILPAGRHELELVNEATELRMKIAVDMQPGKTAKPALSLPTGTMSINAVPWANVWVDGKELGTTPVANLTLTIGPHEVVWRHPQFGERTQRVVVGTTMPVRVVMDFNR